MEITSKGNNQINIYNTLTILDSKINVFIGMVLLLCAIIKDFKVSSIVALIAIAAFFVLLLLNHTIIYFKYLHFIFGSAAAIFGCAVIEFSHMFLLEIATWTRFAGSLPLLIFSWWMLLTSIMYFDNLVLEKQKRNENRRFIIIKDFFSQKDGSKNMIAYIAAIVGCLLIVYVFAVVFKNPSFKLGLDRFQYSSEFDYGFIYDKALRLIDFLLIPIIVVAIYSKKKVAWFALALYCLYAFWVGNKFGIFFSILCLFGIIYSHKLTKKIGGIKKNLIGYILLIVVLIGVAVFAVSFTKTERSSDYLLQRAAQQSQLWWKTFDSTRDIRISEFGDEIKSITNAKGSIGENVGSNFGIYKIMYYTTQYGIVDAKLSSGSRYTEAGFASAYYYGGIIGCILFAILIGAMTSFFVNSFLWYLRNNQYIRAFIYYRFYTYTLVFASMFTFFPFFNKTSLLCYVILAACNKKVFTFGKQQI